MDDKTSLGDEEYQFSDTAEGDLYGVEQTGTKVAVFKRYKKIIILVSIILVVYAVYKISGLFTEQIERQPAPAPQVIQQLPAVPVVTTVPVS